MTTTTATPLTIGTRSSAVVDQCQVCRSGDLRSLVFLGFLPPVNEMRPIGERPKEQPSYPAEMLLCKKCGLAQLGLVVDPQILFPPEYPYTSGTTKILRENFAELYTDCQGVLALKPEDLVVDIGSNDGTLLSNFQGKHRVQGIEPTNAGLLARKRGIATKTAFFNQAVAGEVRADVGPAKVVTAANVFAHIEDVHAITAGVVSMLADDGVFISESHYLRGLIETVQYDTIYHEHLRYYSLRSLKHLLEMHGLTVIHAKRIPTHGGSIRVYAARAGRYEPRPSVEALMKEEDAVLTDEGFAKFKEKVVLSKLQLYDLLWDIKRQGKRVYAISAPSRASTLVTYVGLDDGLLDCVLEIKGSYKIGKCMPGTLIPVLDEEKLFTDQPDYALLLSWHIADELIPKLTARGFKGRFIVPLPEARIV